MAKPDLEQFDSFVEEEPANIQQARQTYAIRGPMTSRKAKALMKERPDGTREIAGCVMQVYGLDVPDHATIQDIELATSAFIQIGERLNLWVGDLLASAERLNYGDITEWAAVLGYNAKTLRNWKYICLNVPVSLRRDIYEAEPDAKPLSISHYELVASMSLSEQERWLKDAIYGNWSVAKLRLKIENRKIITKTTLQRFKERQDHERDKIRLRSKKNFNTWYALAREQMEAWSALVSDLEDDRPF